MGENAWTLLLDLVASIFLSAHAYQSNAQFSPSLLSASTLWLWFLSSFGSFVFDVHVDIVSNGLNLKSYIWHAFELFLSLIILITCFQRYIYGSGTYSQEKYALKRAKRLERIRIDKELYGFEDALLQFDLSLHEEDPVYFREVLYDSNEEIRVFESGSIDIGFLRQGTECHFFPNMISNEDDSHFLNWIFNDSNLGAVIIFGTFLIGYLNSKGFGASDDVFVMIYILKAFFMFPQFVIHTIEADKISTSENRVPYRISILLPIATCIILLRSTVDAALFIWDWSSSEYFIAESQVILVLITLRLLIQGLAAGAILGIYVGGRLIRSELVRDDLEREESDLSETDEEEILQYTITESCFRCCDCTTSSNLEASRHVHGVQQHDQPSLIPSMSMDNYLNRHNSLGDVSHRPCALPPVQIPFTDLIEELEWQQVSQRLRDTRFRHARSRLLSWFRGNSNDEEGLRRWRKRRNRLFAMEPLPAYRNDNFI